MIAAHQIESGDWTGGGAPEPQVKKSRFSVWADNHPAVTLAATVLAWVLIAPIDVRSLSLEQYWLGVATSAAWIVLFFGGLVALYLLVSKISQSGHLATFQRRYLMGMGFVAFLMFILGVPRLTASWFHVLMGHL